MNPSSGIHIVDLGIVLAYLLLMLFLGLKGMRLSETSSDYLIAGRSLGYTLYIGCLAAVALGGASTVGGAKLGYEFGISGMWLVFMIGLGILALGLFLTTRLSNLRVLSISEMLEVRYSSQARLLSAVIMAVYAAMIAVIQVIAIGTILHAMLDWGLGPGILVGGAVVLTYTLLGGMWSISLTDFIQFVLMTFGIFFVMLPASLAAAGGWKGLSAGLPESHFSLSTIGYSTILSFVLLYFLGLIIGQDIWQRVFTARNARVARKGTVIAGFYCIFYAMAMALIGMCAAVLMPDLEDPQDAFGVVAVTLLPVGLRGIVLAGTLSALMSTASGPLLASSTLIASDIYRRFLAPHLTDGQFLFATRLTTAAVGIAVVLSALLIQDVIKALDIAYTLLSGSIFGPVFAGLFWKRANAVGTLVSMLFSAAVAVVSMSYWGIGSTTPILLALGTSVATLVVVSLATTPTDPDRMSGWQRRLHGGKPGRH